MPKVSIVIPVHNVERYLRKCLDSAAGQTLADIEILCIDDASTDSSPEILAEYAARDPRVRIVTFETNRGVSCARNEGIRSALGEFVGFLDADDFVDPDFYEKLYELASRTGADITKGDVRTYDPRSGALGYSFPLDLNKWLKKSKAYFFYGFCTAIFRTSLLRDNSIFFIEGMKYEEDAVFCAQSALRANSIGVVDSVIYYYTVNPGSVTHARDVSLKIGCIVRGVRATMELISEEGVGRDFYIPMAANCFGKLLDWELWNELRDEDNVLVAETLDWFLDCCRYRQEVISYSFVHARNVFMNQLLRQMKENYRRAR